MSAADAYGSLWALCAKRRSIRDFSERPVSSDDIEKMKEIAYTSPYASGRKNWELVLVTDRAKIAELSCIVRTKAESMKNRLRHDFRESFSHYAETFTAFATAPLLVVPTFRIATALSPMMEGDDHTIAQWERDNYIKSISCVAMLVLLAAESLGLGGCYMTGPLIAEDEIAKALSVKKGRSIGAILPIGYPKVPSHASLG